MSGQSVATFRHGATSYFRGFQTGSLHYFARISLLASAVSLAGCGTSPIVRWNVPTKADVPDYTLAYGITYANKARDAYRAAIQDDSNESRNLGAGLIGLGALVAALAASDVHKSAIVGTSLIGGTAFALGNWNLSKQRLLIYQAGVAGMNCAVEAVLPLYITTADLKAMGGDVGTVDAEVVKTVAAIDNLRDEMGKATLSAEEKAAADQTIKDAQSLVGEARTSTLSARQFMRAAGQAGPALVAAVDRISATVDKAVLDTLPDLSSVPKVVAGLAGLAGSFAPGSQLESTLTAAIKGSNATAQSKVRYIVAKARSAQFQAAMNTLQTQQGTLASALAELKGRLAGFDTAANSVRLAECGLSDVDTALKVTQTHIDLQAQAEATYLVRVSGGSSAVYSGALLREADGLSVKNPLPGDRSFQITTTKALTQTGDFPLLISDAAGKEIQVMLAVAAADPSKPPTESKTPVDKATAVKTLVDWINGNNLQLDVKGITSTLKAAVAGDNVEIAVTCPGPATLSQQDFVEAFEGTYGTQDEVLTATSKGAVVRFKAESDSCLNAGAGQSLGRAIAPRLRAAGKGDLSVLEMQGVQRSLCMAESDVKVGAWGPKSRAALMAWRERMNRKPRSTTILEADEYQILEGGNAQATCGK